MTPADRELRDLRRELLLARAAAERAQLVHQIGLVTGGAVGGRAVAARVLRGALSLSLRRNEFLGALMTLLRFARRQPWAVATFVAGVSRLRRARLLRWLIVAGAIVGTAWWLRRRAPTAAHPSDDVPVEGDETASADAA
jgi:hypothetical protein